MDPIEQLLSRLHHPTLASVDLKLDRMIRLLSLVGNPHKRLPPVIHVAGTNGKGSLIANLKAIFEAAGLRVHVYTSPHLVQFRERIVISGKMIDNAQVTSIASYVVRLLEQQPATFFEATTVIAFLAFAQAKADVVLLETGVGGRLDATNVIEKPALTAITPVSFDHTEYLGDTITKIAFEKAGILKKEVPCVVGRQSEEAMKVLKKRAGELHAPLITMGSEWRVENHHYISQNKNLLLAPALLGEHQFDNAATAIACIENLPQFSISDAHITQGIANAKWPARLQKLTQGPYRDILPQGIELWLDGGHNAQGAEVLAAWLKEKNHPVFMVCGMVGRKDSEAYMQPLLPYVKHLWAVAIPGESESKKAQEVANAAKNAGIPTSEAATIEQALGEIAAKATEPSLVVIAGSLYLAGFVLRNHT